MKTQYILLLFVLSLVACKKNETPDEQISKGHLNVTGIQLGDHKEIVSLNLASMKKGVSHSINAYYFGSTLFDPNTKSFGYCGEDSTYRFVNLITGNVIHEIHLPFGSLTQTVIDADDSCLIGLSSNNDSMFIVKININTGTILSQHKLQDVQLGVSACSYFYNDYENKYFVIRETNTLLTVNPDNGTYLNTTQLPEEVTNITYDESQNQFIGFSYDPNLDSNYVITLNVETGNVIHKSIIKERNDYYGCVSEFDSESNCYVLVTANNEIQFIDITSGETKQKLHLDFAISEFKFWRN